MKSSKNRTLLLLIAAFMLLTLSLNIGKALYVAEKIISITKPLAYGILIALALDSAVDFFQKMIFRRANFNSSKARTISVMITLILVVVIIAGSCYIIVPNISKSLNTVAQRAPYYAVKINEKLSELTTRLGLTLTENETLLGNTKQLLFRVQTYASAVAVTVMDLARSIFNFLLAFVFSVYLLIRKENIVELLNRINNAFTSNRFYDRIYQYSLDFARTFKRFVSGQIAEGAILGILCFIGMLIIRLPYAGLISVLIALTSLIPIFGAYIGALPALLLLLLENPVQALIFIIFIVALQQFEGSVIYPKVVGEAIGLDGLLVFAGVTLGAGFGGLIGVIIGVPLTAVITKALNGALKQKETERGKQR
ncbi:MAG: AI-2E family transporter [Oscillospiraceae bacterium]